MGAPTTGNILPSHQAGTAMIIVRRTPNGASAQYFTGNHQWRRWYRFQDGAYIILHTYIGPAPHARSGRMDRPYSVTSALPGPW